MDARETLAKSKAECASIPPKDEGVRLLRELGFLIFEFQDILPDMHSELEKNDFKNRLTLAYSEVLEYAKPFIASDPVLRGYIRNAQKVEAFVDELSAFDLILQLARKAHENDAKKNERTIKVLEGNIAYDPDNEEVFYKAEIASSPKINSKERAVWKLLYESKASPRRATFALLRECKNLKGQIIFPSLGDEITSDILKWNMKFKKFGVSVLRKDGESIKLEELQLEKK